MASTSDGSTSARCQDCGRAEGRRGAGRQGAEGGDRGAGRILHAEADQGLREKTSGRRKPPPRKPKAEPKIAVHVTNLGTAPIRALAGSNLDELDIGPGEGAEITAPGDTPGSEHGSNCGNWERRHGN